MDVPRRAVSVIIPTYREVANLAELTRRLVAATRADGLEVEVVFVDDDSRDGSEPLVQALSAEYPVRIIVRRGERGLSSAVLAGFAAAQHDLLVVMDADLQHPPEQLPEIVAPLFDGRADFVIGSRYVADASVAGHWPWYRRLNSRVATWLARPLTRVRDPMSGFFALHRQTWQSAAAINPIGYKIGLELLVKGRCRRCVEVPIQFGQRAAGESKLTARQQWQFLRHLTQLYGFRLADLGRPARKSFRRR